MKNGLFSSSIHFFVPLFDVEELQKEEKKKEESKPKSFDSFQYALDNGITNDRNPSQAKRETVMMLSRVHKEVTEKNVSIEKAIRVLVEEINKLKKKK